MSPQFFLSRMLAAGYFPKELPPPFTTFPFSNWAANNRIDPCDLDKPFRTKLVTHSLARPGTNRRVLSIPNPINQLRLVQAIEENYEEIDKSCDGSPFATSTPSFTWRRKRALMPKFERQLTEHKIRARSGGRYLLTADLSRFYQSVYTHSIPWLFHTKDVAKAKRDDMSLFGNLLDKILRESQHGQTLGIPIGPDTSFFLAEALLANVDRRLSKQGVVNGTRWYDDYEVSFYERESAERFAVSLERTLTEFELELNSEKLGIVSLPQPVEYYWVHDLRNIIIPSHKTGQAEQLVSLFSRAFEYAPKHPREGVLKYAIRKLHATVKQAEKEPQLVVHEDNWELVQHLCLQCAVLEPDTLPIVLGLFSYFTIYGFKLDKRLLKSALVRVIEGSANSGFASETAWAIWGHIEHGLVANPETVEIAESVADDVVGCLLFDLRARGLTPENTKFGRLRTIVSDSGFRSEHWLLAYESAKKGWLSNAATATLLDSQEARALIKANVYFYNENLRPYESARHVFGTPDWLYPLIPKA